MKELTWFGRIEAIGNKSAFVKGNVGNDGYLFQCDVDSNQMSITEIIAGDSTVTCLLHFDDDGDLIEAKYYGESYDDVALIEEQLEDILAMLYEDGVIAYDD